MLYFLGEEGANTTLEEKYDSSFSLAEASKLALNILKQVGVYFCCSTRP
jgi:hypothetical protein